MNVVELECSENHIFQMYSVFEKKEKIKMKKIFPLMCLNSNFQRIRFFHYIRIRLIEISKHLKPFEYLKKN